MKSTLKKALKALNKKDEIRRKVLKKKNLPHPYAVVIEIVLVKMLVS